MHVIETERLLLIPFTLDMMAGGVEAIASEYGVAADWPNPDLAEALPMIAAEVARNNTLERWNRLMVLRTTRAVVGEVGFKALPDESGRVEIGYGVAASHRRLGLATEAVVGMCEWGLAQAGVRVVKAECLSDNVGSIGVLWRAGFAEIGRRGELIEWALAE